MTRNLSFVILGSLVWVAPLVNTTAESKYVLVWNKRVFFCIWNTYHHFEHDHAYRLKNYLHICEDHSKRIILCIWSLWCFQFEWSWMRTVSFRIVDDSFMAPIQRSVSIITSMTSKRKLKSIKKITQIKSTLKRLCNMIVWENK